VVNKYGQSWDIPNLFIVGSSTHPSMSGFNPTLAIQALVYMSADARYGRGCPGSIPRFRRPDILDLAIRA
jgi:gluconate 2-dehydrogenase alpha chain